MHGERLDAVIATLRAAASLWTPADRISIVTFGDVGATVCAHSPYEPDAYERMLSELHNDGCTNMSAGMEEMYRIAVVQPLDVLILLTDGLVNMGICSSTGLAAMALGIGRMPIYTLGYGADHERKLLRALAVRSRGAYTYMDTSELMPVAIGSIVAGMRSQVMRNAVLSVDAVCECLELGATDRIQYHMGGLTAERDYWVVFRHAGLTNDIWISLTDEDGNRMSVCAEREFSDAAEVEEQILRCRVASVLAAASDMMESGDSASNQLRALRPELDVASDTVRAVSDQLRALRAELNAASDAVRARPLWLRMIGQVADLEEQVRPTAHAATPTADVLSRLSSGATYFGMQRGTQSAEDPDVFASPSQRVSSTAMRQRTVQRPLSPNAV